MQFYKKKMTGFYQKPSNNSNENKVFFSFTLPLASISILNMKKLVYSP